MLFWMTKDGFIIVIGKLNWGYSLVVEHLPSMQKAACWVSCAKTKSLILIIISYINIYTYNQYH